MESFLFVFIILSTLLTISGWIKYENIMNPITLFCGLWTIILFTYSLHLFELYYASDAVLWSIVIGIAMFYLGAMYKSVVRFKTGRIREIPNMMIGGSTAVEVFPNYTLMTVVNLLSIVILMGYATVTIRMLLSGISYEYIHVMYQSEEGIVGALKSGIRLWHYFVWPWNLATIPMVVSCFMLDKRGAKGRNIFIITSIINIGLYILISGARVSLAYFAFYFVVIMLLLKKKVKLNAWKKALIIILAIAAWIVFDRLSESRNSASLENTAYTYLCGCVPYFSYRLNLFNGKYYYGLHTFSGILKPFFAIFGKIFGASDLWSNVLANLETQGRTYIAPHNPFNAFSSLFYFFYMDGGLIAVAIFSFIYGSFSVSMYNRFLRQRNLKSLVLYLLTAFGLAFSMVRFHFITLRYILSFFYTAICFIQISVNVTRKTR